MSKLTEEQLADIYPQAKTYDEIRANRKQMQEKRRPKMVTLRVALYSALAVLAIVVAYLSGEFLAENFIPATGSPQSTGSVMVGVFGLFLVAIATATTVYSLYSRASALIYLTFVHTKLPTALIALATIVITTVVILLLNYGYDLLVTLGALTIFNFIISYGVVAFSPKQ